MRSSTDTMRLVAMVDPPTSQYAENWRYPLSRQDRLSANFFQDLGRTLERGCFDMLFLPDALAVPEDRDGSYDTTLATGGKGAIYLDPIVTLSMVATVTTHLGLGATMSTTSTPPTPSPGRCSRSTTSPGIGSPGISSPRPRPPRRGTSV